MKKRSMLFTALALVLVAAISIGGTMAYFSSTAAPKTNTITFGNVSIQIDEPNWNQPGGSDFASNLLPGKTFNKDPKITNIGKNPCYVRIALPEGFTAEPIRGWGGSITGYNIKSDLFEIIGLNLGSGATQWTYKDDYFYYNNEIVKDGSTSSLFTGLKLKSNVVNNVANAATLLGHGGPTPPSTIELTSDTIDITINAEAVQSEGNITNNQTGDTNAIKAFNAID